MPTLCGRSSNGTSGQANFHSFTQENLVSKLPVHPTYICNTRSCSRVNTCTYNVHTTMPDLQCFTGWISSSSKSVARCRYGNCLLLLFLDSLPRFDTQPIYYSSLWTTDFKSTVLCFASYTCTCAFKVYKYQVPPPLSSLSTVYAHFRLNQSQFRFTRKLPSLTHNHVV